MTEADNFQWLPQLAVSAKLLCLLMVVICGAVPSMVRSVRLYNDCSSSDVRIDMKGRVLADDNQSERFQNLTIRSLGFSGKLQIHAKESKRILCFNKRWKLVGLLPSNKTKGSMCQFYESMVKNGYSRYRSVANESHYVGFNRRGRPLRAAFAGTLGAREKCLNFLKRDQEFSINAHNSKLAGGNQSSELAVTQTQLNKHNRNKGSGKLKKNTVRIRHHNHHRDTGKQS